MNNLVIKKNNEVTDELLDRVYKFDQSIFSLDSEFAMPTGILQKLYQKSKDGMFVLLDNNEVVGYTNCIFLEDDVMSRYIEDSNFWRLENAGFQPGDNNMYFYMMALKEEYRNTNCIKYLMTEFCNWLDCERKKGKRIHKCIAEPVSEDGIKSVCVMGMKPLKVDESGFGIYYSPDNLDSYIQVMLNRQLPNNKGINNE